MKPIPTFGVEEELLLVDADSGTPLMRNHEVAESARRLGLDVQLELTPCQIETASTVLDSIDELTEELRWSRATLARAAHEVGGRVLAAGVPPLLPDRGPITDTTRYREIAATYGIIAAEQGICGAHIHVGVPDPDAAIQVSNHLRPWLPILLAMTANSALYGGVDTGYASWRSVLWSRWPSAGPPPFMESSAQYEQLVDEMRDVGAILDDGMVYWDVRPSKNFPTVEVRISDVPKSVEDSAMLAALVRAFAMTALGDPHSRVRTPDVSEHSLKLAYWRSALDGLTDCLVDPYTGRLTTAAEAVHALVSAVKPALVTSGDFETVETNVERLLLHGNGSDAQRRALRRTDSFSAAISELAEG